MGRLTVILFLVDRRDAQLALEGIDQVLRHGRSIRQDTRNLGRLGCNEKGGDDSSGDGESRGECVGEDLQDQRLGRPRNRTNMRSVRNGISFPGVQEQETNASEGEDE